jgi:membrane protease YdiL (CAAX protease family)
MKLIRYLLNRQPLVSVFIVMVLVAVTTAGLFALFVSLLESQSLAQAGAMSGTGLLLLASLVWGGAGKGAGITVAPHDWGTKWWTVVLLMTALPLTSLLTAEIDVAALVFDSRHAIEWLLQNLATGLFEEVWFRGVCFYILYRAWGSTRSGLYKAALTQALLFGILHLSNIHRSPLDAVLYQTVYSTLIGFGLAGLVAYSRSLWLAVLLHAAVNAAGSVDNFFAGPVYDFPETTAGTMLIVLGVFFLFGAVPGAWCLKQAPLFKASL